MPTQKNQAGFVSIEAALVLPFFFFVIALLAQLALLAVANTAVQGAAENSAEAAAQFGSDKQRGYAAAENAAREIPGLNTIESSITYSTDTVSVEITGTPFKILPIDLRVSAQVDTPIERAISPGQRR